MIEQLSTPIRFAAHYTYDGTNKTGLTGLTAKVYAPDGTLAGTPAVTELGDGIYRTATLSPTQMGEYLCVFTAPAGTTDVRNVSAAFTVGRGGIGNLDAAISSRATAAQVWTNGTRTITGGAGTSTLTIGDVQTAMTSQGFTAARGTKLDNLDAAVSTRSTYAGGDTAGTITLLNRLTAPRATLLDNLDASIASLPASIWGYTTRTITGGGGGSSITIADVQTALTNQGLTITRAGNLDRLDTTVSSRATSAALAAAAGKIDGLDLRITPSRAAKLDALDVPISSVGGIVWGTGPDDYDDYGSNFGGVANRTFQNTEGGRGDTAGVTTLLGRLTAPRAAKLDQLDAAVSSRSSHSVADVWAHSARTLTSFGTIVAGIWSAATRTLTQAISGGLSKAEVREAMAEQGYTSVRAPRLDNLDAQVSTRATPADLAALGASPITLLSPMTGALSAAIDLNWDWTAGNGLALTFDVGTAAVPTGAAIGLYSDGVPILSGATSAQGGDTIVTVPVTRGQAGMLGRGDHRLELGYEAVGVRTMLAGVFLEIR